MLHVWLIPLIAIFVIALLVSYIMVRCRGGDGVRTCGRMLVDNPSKDEDDDGPPP